MVPLGRIWLESWRPDFGGFTIRFLVSRSAEAGSELHLGGGGGLNLLKLTRLWGLRGLHYLNLVPFGGYGAYLS